MGETKTRKTTQNLAWINNFSFSTGKNVFCYIIKSSQPFLGVADSVSPVALYISLNFNFDTKIRIP